MPAERASKRSSTARAIPAAYSLKARVMHSLDQAKPVTTRVLSQKLGLHQSSVSHALKALMEEDLAIKKGKSYLLSNVGIIQKITQERMEKTLRYLADNKNFLLSHDLSGIPPGFQVTMGVIDGERETIERDPAIPSHIHDIIVPLLAKARHFLVASSTMVAEHQMTAAQAVREGGDMQAVTTERIIQELRQRGSYALRDASLHSRMELHRRNDINLHLIVTESHLFLALPRPDGTLDLQNIIVSRNQEALNWGRMLFYYFLSGAEKVDLATF